MNKVEVKKIKRAMTAAKIARDLPFSYARNPYQEARDEINAVCDAASAMCGAMHPDEMEPARENIERTRRELLKLTRVLKKEKNDA